MSTTTPLSAKFPIAIDSENMHETIRFCEDDLTKYIAKLEIPASNIVVTKREKCYF